jgi:hypothetical protein
MTTSTPRSRDDIAADMTSCYELRVTGNLSTSVAEIIEVRFGTVMITRAGTTTVLGVDNLDQAALRALLTLLWDAGQEVQALSRTADTTLPGSPGDGW